MKVRLIQYTLLLASSAQATEYTVSPISDDGNAGTRSAPLRTIRPAARLMKPGDICTLRGGRYFQENVLDGLHGENDRPIAFRATPDL